MRKIEEETQILTEILKLLPTQVFKKVTTAVTAHCTEENESLKPSTIAIFALVCNIVVYKQKPKHKRNWKPKHKRNWKR